MQVVKLEIDFTKKTGNVIDMAKIRETINGKTEDSIASSSSEEEEEEQRKNDKRNEYDYDDDFVDDKEEALETDLIDVGYFVWKGPVDHFIQSYISPFDEEVKFSLVSSIPTPKKKIATPKKAIVPDSPLSAKKIKGKKSLLPVLLDTVVEVESSDPFEPVKPKKVIKPKEVEPDVKATKKIVKKDIVNVDPTASNASDIVKPPVKKIAKPTKKQETTTNASSIISAPVISSIPSLVDPNALLPTSTTSAAATPTKRKISTDSSKDAKRKKLSISIETSPIKFTRPNTLEHSNIPSKDILTHHLEILSTASQEFMELMNNRDEKKNFPEKLKPLLLNVSLAGVEMSIPEDQVYERITRILPYNLYTISKLVKRISLIDDCRFTNGILDKCFTDLKKIIDNQLLDQVKVDEKTKFRFSIEIKQLLATILAYSSSLGEYENELAFLKGEKSVSSDFKVRAQLYTRVVEMFPAEWNMTSGEVGKVLSTYRSSLVKKEKKEEEVREEKKEDGGTIVVD